MSNYHIKQLLIKKYGDICVYQATKHCSGKYEHTDHYIPLYHGGKDVIDNLRPACKACNLSKGKKLPKDFIKPISKKEKITMNDIFIKISPYEQITYLKNIGITPDIYKTYYHDMMIDNSSKAEQSSQPTNNYQWDISLGQRDGRTVIIGTPVDEKHKSYLKGGRVTTSIISDRMRFQVTDTAKRAGLKGIPKATILKQLQEKSPDVYTKVMSILNEQKGI